MQATRELILASIHDNTHFVHATYAGVCSPRHTRDRSIPSSFTRRQRVWLEFFMKFNFSLVTIDAYFSVKANLALPSDVCLPVPSMLTLHQRSCSHVTLHVPS